MQCPYGSIWRKWDFHVHTPYSILNNKFGFNPFELDEIELEKEFDEYVKQLFTLAVENNIAAIGITDYFMLEGYKRIKERYLSSPSKMQQCFPDDDLRNKVEKILVFPNIELRLENFVGKNASSVNYHVIFSNDVKIQEIEDNFLHKVEFSYDSGSKLSLTLSNIEKLGKQIKANNNNSGSDLLVGLKHVTVNYTDIQNVLDNNDEFKNKYLITVPVDEDLSQISWSGRDYSIRRIIYKQCHCLLTSNEKTINWALASGREDEQIREFGSIKPCIWGSDAHDYQRMFKPAEDRYCWVKSEPTFEGLLQVVYEPSERVCIQKEQPGIEDVHQIIDSVKFENEFFQETPIYFNRSLTCIIGGKSTGKSMLLRQMARAIDNDYARQQEGPQQYIKFPSVKTTVTWKDGTTNGRKIVYIPQTFLNNTIDNPEQATAINNIIFDVLLQEPAIKVAYDNLNADRDKIQNKVRQLIDGLVSDKAKLADLNELIMKEGVSSTYNETIQRLEAERTALAQNVNVTSEEIDRFNEVEKNIESIILENEKLQGELENQKKISNVSVVVPGYFSCLDGLPIEHDFSKDFSVTESALISALKTLNDEIAPKWTTVIDSNCKELQLLISKNNLKLDSLKKEYGVLKEKVAQGEQLGKLTTRINAERKFLQFAIEREKQRDDILKRIKETKEKIIASQSEYLQIYSDFCEIIRSTGTSKNTSLIFDAEIIWKQTEFMACLAQLFNNKNFTPFRTEYNYDLTALKTDNYGEKFLTTLWNAWEEPMKYGGLSFKAGNTLTTVLSNIFKNWYNIHYIVKSGNDSIESMSPGKKALVLLEMIISLEDSKCPILIDQPEDDLDNRSIYNDLVQYIRRKKKERQIIIVTHNANVVLGADSEEIIIANQEGIGTENLEKRFEYRSGAIENDEVLTSEDGIPLKGILNQKGIQTQICDILEGGRSAFKLRQNKYAGVQGD
jgi:ABC-type enterochelin transport system ATPase subunit